jgi:predicted DsbA family dithiol-disulfide isomerase
MKMSRTAVLLTLAAGFATSGCSQPSSTAEAAGVPALKVVAQVAGKPIGWDEMEKKAGSRLAAVRQEEYEARLDAINELAYERLLSEEATKRKLTTDGLLSAEVDAKVEKVAPTEVEAVYEANKARVVGRPRAEVLVAIEQQMNARRRAERESAFREELVGRGELKIELEAPRFPLAFAPSTPTQGPENAPVTLVEFSDYQCPYCHQAQKAVEEVMKKYEGRVRFVHGEYPLPQHPRAFAASQASRCAGEQSRFWEYHQNLLNQPGDYEEPELLARGKAIGLDTARFAACLASNRFDAEIDAGRRIGTEAGVNSTPTFFINGRKFRGARRAEAFSKVIDDELNRVGR